MEKFFKKIVVGIVVFLLLLPIINLLTPIVIGNPANKNDHMILYLSFVMWFVLIIYLVRRREIKFEKRNFIYLFWATSLAFVPFLVITLVRENKIEHSINDSGELVVKDDGKVIINYWEDSYDGKMSEVYTPMIQDYIYLKSVVKE